MRMNPIMVKTDQIREWSNQYRLICPDAVRGRELVKLPHGNQADALQTIISHGLTSRESAVLAERLLKAKNAREAEYIYQHIHQVIREASQERDLYNSRLSDHGNQLLKARELLRLQVNILTGILQSEHTAQLPVEQKKIVLPGMNELVGPMGRLTDIIHQTLKLYVLKRVQGIVHHLCCHDQRPKPRGV